MQAGLAGEFRHVNACGYTEDGAGGGMNLRSRVTVCNGIGAVYDVNMVLLEELQPICGRGKLCDLPQSSPLIYQDAGRASEKLRQRG